jgi:hypothetical protein
MEPNVAEAVIESLRSAGLYRDKESTRENIANYLGD